MSESNTQVRLVPSDLTEVPRGAEAPRYRRGGVAFGLAALLLLIGGLAYGAWTHYTRNSEVASTAKHHRDFVPNVRVAEVRDSGNTINVSLPATTLAFTTANIFARTSGYIDKRSADIGDRFKQGDLLAQITAPELDHQITQAQATLELNKATLRQNIANRDLAQITWDRDRPLVAKGYTASQQGSVDVQNLKALEATVGVSQASVEAQQAQIKVLYQQKAYQSVVAPFDGVITQRNIDVGDLVQGDATSGTFMFTLQKTDVIRTWVYVPQDQAVGLEPGVDAVMRVPEMPNRTFPGKVTRIAEALQPATRTLLTEIDVPNPDGAIAAGVYCTVELRIPRVGLSLMVPAEAVIFDREGLHVAVVENGIAHMRKLSVVRDFGTAVEVNKGVMKGDRVILQPPVDLVEGSRVNAQPDPPADQPS
jgi:RND family efflux transporter MFP subunit